MLVSTAQQSWSVIYLCCDLLISHSVVSNILRPHGLQPARLLCPWDSLGRNTGVGCHFLLQYTAGRGIKTRNGVYKKNISFSWWWPEQYSKHPLMIKETLLTGKRGIHWMGLQFPLSEKQNWKQFQKQNSEKHLGIMSHWSSKFLSDVQSSYPLLSNEIPRDEAMV